MNKLGALLLLIWFSPAFAGDGPFLYNKTDLLPSGLQYSIEITEVPYKSSPSTPPDDGGMWGIDGGYCTYVINKFLIKINNKQVHIYRKYYADICNLTSLQVLEEKKQPVIVIRGGDAAGAFVAKYIFSGNKLIQRIVRMAEMPNDYWESIIIHHDL